MAEILFLAHRAPWPPDRGDRIRSWHMVKALAKLAPVHVAALADTQSDAATARAKMAPLCESLTIEVRRTSRPAALARALLCGEPVSNRLFRSQALARRVDTLLRGDRISHIVAFSGQMAQYVPHDFRGRVIMDFVDVDSAKFATYAAEDRRQPWRWIHAREARTLAAHERATARRVDASLFVSAAEASLFRSRSGLDDHLIHAIENGIDTSYFDPAAVWDPVTVEQGPLAVFTGQMDYRPNIDAVRWFAADVLPLLHKRHPTARLAIVGRAPTDAVRSLARKPQVTVTGEVADVRPWLAAADVVVAPLRVARGVQNKLLEAMAMARPVVASTAAAEGVDAAPGAHLCVADDVEAMAAAVSALIDDPAAAAAMGAAAREQMIARYGWDARLAPLGDLLGLAP